MKTKTGLLILLLLLLSATATAIVATRNQLSPEDRRAERIILSYIADKGLPVFPGTREYSQFMKGILLGEYPELTDMRSGYLENPEDVNRILNYAARNLKLPRNAIDGTAIPEAPTPLP